MELKLKLQLFQDLEFGKLYQISFKKSKNLEDFKLKINLWNPGNCPCRLCRGCLPQVGCL